MTDKPLLSNLAKAMSKKELALMYFPYSTPHVAVNHLMAWINQDPPLLQALAETGYQKTNKFFTPRQARLILEEFGQP